MTLRENLKANMYYYFAETKYGYLLLGATDIGLAYAGFVDNDAQMLSEMAKRFPEHSVTERKTPLHEAFLSWLKDQSLPKTLPLDLFGTEFQRKVWDELLRIPTNERTTYGALAQKVGSPKAARAIGGAVGRNPISIYIPCHRVLASSGALGGYHWGIARKKMLLESEGHDIS